MNCKSVEKLNWEKVGELVVDSGAFLITDPSNKTKVEISNFGGDGYYNVYVQKANKEFPHLVSRVLIELDHQNVSSNGIRYKIARNDLVKKVFGYISAFGTNAVGKPVSSKPKKTFGYISTYPSADASAFGTNAVGKPVSSKPKKT